MAIDAYLYKPLNAELIKRIETTEGINIGSFSHGKSFVATISDDSTPSAKLLFGKDIEIPFGRQSQGPEKKDRTEKFEYLVSLVIDGPNTHRRGYREQIEELMFKHLKLNSSSFEFIGIYSGDRGKLVTDFN